MTSRNRFLISTGVAVLTVLAGCSSDKKGDAFQDPFFPPSQNIPASKTMAQRQAAIGALEDGMLYAVHFDGDALNSLGQQKLDAMLSVKPEHTPLKLFLNLPKDDATTTARQANVETILKDKGLAADQYAVAVGPNPGALRSAAAGVRALDLTRGTQGDATASGESTNLPVGAK